MERFLQKNANDFDFRALEGGGDFAARFLGIVNADALVDELAASIAWVRENVPKTPVGAACPLRTPTDIKQLLDKGTEGVLSAGSLSALSLSASAVATIDTGRISLLLTNYRTLKSFKAMVGKVIINASVWDGNSYEQLIRADKDAEVQAMCLVAYWCKIPQVSEAFADLTFEFRYNGTGSRSLTATLKLCENEDNLRSVLGLSGRRKVCVYSDLVQMMLDEGRFTDGADVGDRLIKVLNEDGVSPGKLNADTMKRYIHLGRRCGNDIVKSCLEKWEALNRRDSLVDGITVLRGVCSSTENDVELGTILHELMLQQRAGLRKQLITPRSHNDAVTPANIAKGILLRNFIYTHVLRSFPKHKELIERFAPSAFYLAQFGIDENGIRVSDPPDEDADADSVVDAGGQADGGPTSSYKSRLPLEKFLKSLMFNKLERVICSMAKSSSQNTLDLTTEEAKSIKASLDEIAGHYVADFPPIQVAVNAGVVRHTVESSSVLTVVTEGAPLTHDEYKLQLADFQKRVADFDKAKLEAFINNRVAFVVDDLATEGSLKRKLNSVPLMKETRRKVFVHDEMCARGVDLQQCRAQKKSIFTPLKQNMTRESMDMVMSLYEEFKSVVDDAKGSDDVIVVLMPGPPPNSPVNKNVQVAHMALTRHVPKLQPPKIGNVEARVADYLSRTKAKSAFGGSSQNNIIFTKQGSSPFLRKTMSNLGGDNFINKWCVPLIPFPQLVNVKCDDYEELLGASDKAPLEGDVDVDSCQVTSDELVLGNERVVPFPHEYDMALGMEMLDTFDSDILIGIYPGSGEMLKAVLSKQKHGVAICATKAHKTFILNNIRDWVKRMNLVNFSDRPQKPRALLNFEVAMQTSARAATTTPPAPAPAPALERPQAITTVEAKAHPVAPVVPVGGRATAEPVIPAKAPSLMAFGSSLL